MIDLKTIKIIIYIVSAAIIILPFLCFRHKRKELSLVFLSLLFSIFIVELFLRFYYPQISENDRMFEYDKKLGWKFIKNKKGLIAHTDEAYHYIETNYLGFRDNSPPSDQNNTRKVLVLGDSFVSNIAVRDSEVFTEVMERKLNNTAVLNFGVNGYGQIQEYLLLKEWFEKTKPDIVILVIYIRNDFDDNLGGHWLYPRPVASWDREYSTLKINPAPPAAPSKELSFKQLLRSIYKKAHFYEFIKRKIDILEDKYMQANKLEYKSSRITPPELYLCRIDSSENTKLLYRTMEEILLRIAQYVEERNVPLVFAIAPSILQVEDDLWLTLLESYGENPEEYERSLPNKRLMNFAAKNNLQMIDLLPILQSERRKGRPSYNRNEQHWNGEGNRIVAHALLDYLKTRSLVSPLSPP